MLFIYIAAALMALGVSYGSFVLFTLVLASDGMHGADYGLALFMTLTISALALAGAIALFYYAKEELVYWF